MKRFCYAREQAWPYTRTEYPVYEYDDDVEYIRDAGGAKFKVILTILIFKISSRFRDNNRKSYI